MMCYSPVYVFSHRNELSLLCKCLTSLNLTTHKLKDYITYKYINQLNTHNQGSHYFIETKFPDFSLINFRNSMMRLTLAPLPFDSFSVDCIDQIHTATKR